MYATKQYPAAAVKIVKLRDIMMLKLIWYGDDKKEVV